MTCACGDRRCFIFSSYLHMEQIIRGCVRCACVDILQHGEQEGVGQSDTVKALNVDSPLGSVFSLRDLSLLFVEEKGWENP